MRLDQTLVARGLVPSRARARDLIKRGYVRVAGLVCDKPAFAIKAETPVAVASDSPAYVSRGAEKLAAAMDAFAFGAKDKVVLDVGASTGGFTEVLLERGARRVYAVDVGHGQLHARLKNDPRVVSVEGLDARDISADHIAETVDAVVADVSFVSATKVLAPAMTLARGKAWLVVLVKPQFEVGRGHVGKGGIVRDKAARHAAVDHVMGWIAAQSGWHIVGQTPSPILGGSGNAEFLVGACRDG